MGKPRKKKKPDFQYELEEYWKQGVDLWLKGEQSTPGEIAQACAIAEGDGYMRDYIQNEEGVIERVEFNPVKRVEKEK